MGIWSDPIALERAEEIASKISAGMICLNSNCGPNLDPQASTALPLSPLYQARLQFSRIQRNLGYSTVWFCSTGIWRS